MTVNSQIVANTVVMRFRLRSAAAEPSAAPLAPPNMSESPPPCPLWSKTPTMRDNIETTFKTRVMYITMDRTKRNPIALSGALPYGYRGLFGEMARHHSPGPISLQRGLNRRTEVCCLPAASAESATRRRVNRRRHIAHKANTLA